MHKTLLLLTLVSLSLSGSAAEKALSEDRILLRDLALAKIPGERAAIVDDALGRKPAVLGRFAEQFGGLIKDKEASYRADVAAQVKRLYLKRLNALTDEQIRDLLVTRLMWSDFVVRGYVWPSTEVYNKVAEAGANRIRAMLLIPLEEITTDSALGARHTELLELGGYQDRLDLALKKDPASVVAARRAPTGIPYPPLDEPTTYQVHLDRCVRSLIMAHSLALPGDAKRLMENVELAKEIDVQEAAAFLYMNERRLLVGSTAVFIDPLLTACTRDHSIDRVEGRAEGHGSSVPGKASFVDRINRFGGRACGGEGAGGGRDWKQAVDLFCYGGGHTRGIYSPRGLYMGFGRHKGAYTFVGDGANNDPCPMNHNTPDMPMSEAFLPPGVEPGQLNGKLREICKAILGNRAGRSEDLALLRRLATSAPAGDKPADVANAKKVEELRADTSLNGAALRFIGQYLEAKVARELAGLETMHDIGDVTVFIDALASAKQKYQGVASFDQATAGYEAAMKEPSFRAEYTRGAEYHAAADAALAYLKGKLVPAKDANGKPPAVTPETAVESVAKSFEAFAAKHPGSVYAKAATEAARRLRLNDVKDFFDPFRAYFSDKFRSVAKTLYPKVPEWAR